MSQQVSDTVLNQRNNSTELFRLETKPFDSVVPSRENKSIVKSSSTYSMPPMCTRPSVTRKGSSLSPAGQKRRRSSSLVNTASKNDDYLGAATPLWLRAYKGEQLAVAINLVSCIIAVGTWSPFILSTLAHGLCQPIKLPIIGYPSRMRPVYTMHPAIVNLPQNTNPPSRCVIQVTPDRIADFRWWAYASAGLLLPCLLFFLDLGLREGCWRALCYSDRTDNKLDTKQRRGKKGTNQTAIKSLRATDSSRTYRCADSKSLRHFPRTDQKTTSDQKLVEVIRLDELWNKRMAETVDNTTDVQDVPGSTSDT
ncbi:putative transcript [Fasciola gigantica]|uniref:Putative transcript n=1 Tax=Fasciola gigantica TaxID=46835 RepID=A0A504Z9Z7_FASGI|nr:putative transcript [Fasciola gigantica]